ncbi:MAG: hypothetical protein MUP16_05080 [Sedimentisphaerales bacterium]|nr:hypothetical protein [Sedimentisphaerales bacterium]
MMVVRIRRFSILQTGKLLAVLYGFYSAFLLLIFLVILFVNPKEALPMLLMIILFPIMGFIGGVIASVVYNLVSRLIGGLELTLEVTQEQNN